MLKVKAPKFRPNLVDQATTELGEKIRAEEDASRARRGEETSLVRSIGQKAAELGIPTEILSDRPADVDEGSRMMIQAESDDSRDQAQAAEPSAEETE